MRRSYNYNTFEGVTVMQFYNIQPTDDNVYETFIKNTIDRNGDVIKFIEILNNIEGGCSIALESEWGNGKTFFVKQAKMILDAYNRFVEMGLEDDKINIIKSICKESLNQKEDIKNQVTVYYDAWENDNDTDPLMSIIHSIIEETDKSIPFKKSTKAVEIAASIIDVIIDRDTNKLVKGIKGEDLLENARGNRELKEKIKEFFDSLLEERGDRLVIFIDELDRCSPNYAVKLLERVKHYFSCDRVTFVFSVNINELQHTIKNCYGEGFDACKYLDRFFDLPIPLPPVNLEKYYEYINYPDEYFIYDVVAKAVIKEFKFGLREIAKYVSLIKKSAQTAVHNKRISQGAIGRAGREFAITYFLPIMIGLEISDVSDYKAFIDGRNVSPVLDISKYFENTSIFDRLLPQGKTFENPMIRLEDLLTQAYDAVFNYEFLGGEYYRCVGECTFEGKLKEELIQIISLLSKYADLSL